MEAEEILKRRLSKGLATPDSRFHIKKRTISSKQTYLPRTLSINRRDTLKFRYPLTQKILWLKCCIPKKN